MHNKMWNIFVGLCGLFTLAALAIPASAQEVKSKPPMYSYVAEWQIPRDKWPDMTKELASTDGAMEKALADGTLIGYGHDEAVVHSADGSTHDMWWSAKSMAGLLNVLQLVSGTGSNTGSTLSSATKHYDNIYVSRYYNYKPGSFKRAYSHVSVYKLKASAPDNALEQLSEHLIVPAMEKLIADGTIIEYEIDTQAIHSDDPNTFVLIYASPTPEGLDEVAAAIRELGKTHPLGGQAFGSMTEDSGHRDYLVQGDGAYK